MMSVFGSKGRATIKEDDIAEFQKFVNERYALIKSLIEVTGKRIESH